MRIDNFGFLSSVGCRFFALGPLLPDDGVEIRVPVKRRDLPAGTAKIKVVNATGKHVGAWNIDAAHGDPHSEIELSLLDLNR